MRRASARWLVVALAAGCSVHDPDTTGGDPSLVPIHLPPHGGGSGNGSGSGGGAPVCDALGPTGSVLARGDLGLGGGTFGPLNNLALGRDRLLFASNAARGSSRPGETLQLDLRAQVIGSFAFGSVVASDAAGDLFIAGGFTTPTDFGLGVLTPMGNIDTFVVELDPRGAIVRQLQLGECGDGVSSLAIAPDGRIAVSGSAMGTVVVDPTGNLLFAADLAGDLAFDSQGNLVIGGSSMGSAILEKLDRSGAVVLRDVIADATLNSVAVGPGDEIAFVGDYSSSIDLFGTIYTVRFNPELRISGIYYVLLDAAGNVVFKNGDFLAIATSGVAIDLRGNVVISGAIASAAFNRRSLVFELDPAGDLVFADEDVALPGQGMGHAVTTDRCGDIWVSVDNSRAFIDMRQFVLKIAH